MITGTVNLKEMVPIIERKYGSLEQPNFSFVEKERSKNPYQKLEVLLKESFEVEDVTDDVSFCYVIDKKWLLQLSMVGSYAVVLGLAKRVHVVALDTVSEAEQKLLGLLVEHGFIVFHRESLELPVNLKLFNAAPENVCLYQALFSDTDVLPWKA